MHFKSKPKVNEKSKTTKLKHELVQKHPQMMPKWRYFADVFVQVHILLVVSHRNKFHFLFLHIILG